MRKVTFIHKACRHEAYGLYFTGGENIRIYTNSSYPRKFKYLMPSPTIKVGYEYFMSILSNREDICSV